MIETVLDGFNSRVEKTDLCWNWIGTKNKSGYGTYRGHMAHRMAFFFAFGRLSKELLICHRCDNPSCVRPDHLFEGTARDNARDAFAKGRLNILEASKATRFKKGNKVNVLGPISDQQILEIRALFDNGIKQTVIAKQFGLMRNVVWKIVRRKSYTHV